MATNYPGSLDDFATTSPAKLSDDDSTGRTHAERHNDVESAVEAIQGELGTDPAGAQATVKARLEVLERSPAGSTVWISGGYTSNIQNATGSAATATLTADRQYYVPFWCPISVTVDRIAVSVFTAQASANARLGIYSPDATTHGPGALLLDAGEIDCSGTGVKELTVSQALSEGTLYWLSVLNETTNVAMLMPNANGGQRGIGHFPSTATSAAVTGLYETGATYTSGLVSTAAAVGSLTVGSTFTPMFWLRRT